MTHDVRDRGVLKVCNVCQSRGLRLEQHFLRDGLQRNQPLCAARLATDLNSVVEDAPAGRINAISASSIDPYFQQILIEAVSKRAHRHLACRVRDRQRMYKHEQTWKQTCAPGASVRIDVRGKEAIRRQYRNQVVDYFLRLSSNT